MIKLQRKYNFLVLAVFMAIFLVYFGYKKVENIKKQSENSAIEMQKKIDEQQTRLNELSEAKNQQDQELNNIKNAQDVASCQKLREECKNKIYKLQSESNRGDEIKSINEKIDDWKKGMKEEGMSDTNIKVMQDNIKRSKGEIDEINRSVPIAQKQLAELLNGECKDYQNPCE